MHAAPLLFSLASTPHTGQSLAVVLVILLVTAAVVSTLFRMLKLEAIPGYLFAGVLVGPGALGLIQNEDVTHQVSELATVLLMFTIGLHLDMSSMRRGMVHIVGVAAISTVLVTLVLWSVNMMLGVSRPAALILAMGGSLSSTAILARILFARREVQSQHGRIAVGVSIVQDLASVVMLAAMPVLVQWEGGEVTQTAPSLFVTGLPEWLDKALLAAFRASGVFLMVWGGRFVLPRLLGGVARLASQELVLVVSAAIALLSALWTSFIGFSPEMGAFIAGFLLAGTPFRYQLAGQIGPMRDLLMAIFFTGVGLRVIPADVLPILPAVLAATVAVIVIKTLIIGGSGYVAGMTAPAGLVTGVYLANAGEFTLIVLAAAGTAIAPAESAAAVTVVMLSLIATPMLVKPAHLLADRMTHVPLSRWVRGGVLRDPVEVTPVVPSTDGQAPAVAARPHVIIAGFGPVGRALADRLAVRDVPFVVVELNAKTVERQATLGRPIVYGDISNREVLEQAGIHKAEAIFLTVPDDEATLHACYAIREVNPRIFIAARTKFLSGKVAALGLGADVVTVEEVATAFAMERDAMEGLTSWREKRSAVAPTPTTPSTA